MRSLKNMPSRKEFADAQRTLEARGFVHEFSVMADDAKKEGVTNFGQFFVKRGDEKVEFFLNFKTIGNLPGGEVDGSEWDDGDRGRFPYGNR